MCRSVLKGLSFKKVPFEKVPFRKVGLFRYPSAVSVAFFALASHCSSAKEYDLVAMANEALAKHTYAVSKQYNGSREMHSLVQLEQWQSAQPCSEEPVLSIQSVKTVGKVNVTVSCMGDSYWKLKLPAQIDFSVPAVTASKEISRKNKLGLDNLKQTLTPYSQIKTEFFIDPDELGDKVAVRTITAGTVIAPAMIKQTDAVVRGALVTVHAANAKVSVQTTGTALTSGRLGDKVQVRREGKQVIQGTVTGENEVAVTP